MQSNLSFGRLRWLVAGLAMALPLFAPSARAADVAPTGAAESEKTPPRNVVFILADDLGWRDLGCYGSTFDETPSLDRFARGAMRFTDAYAACPVCSPTRASILTGKYPARLKITDFFGAKQPEAWVRNTRLRPAHYREQLPLEETTLAEAFHAAGYATFFAGKWHLGEEPYWPEHQGFDINRGGWSAGGPYGGHKYFSPYGNPRLEDGPPGEHLPDRLASETVRFLESHRDRPFFAYLSFYSVHEPLMARADLQAKYEAKAKALAEADDAPAADAWTHEGSRRVRRVQNHPVYAGMVEAMDAAVGKVLAALQRLGLEENTIVVFTSDNGGLATAPLAPTSNAPLRAGKAWIYEGGIREPLIIRWPGVTPPDSVCRVPVTSTDLYPTLLAMAGLPPRPQQTLDGESLVPLLRPAAEGQPALQRDALYWHYPHYGNCGGAPSGAIRQGDWKLIEWYETGKLELFNLADDPGESHDLADEQPAMAARFKAKLHDWLKAVDAEMPTPNPQYDPQGPDGRQAPPP